MQEIGAFMLPLAVSVAVVVLRRRHPVLAVGWAWYLTTVLPVIGVLMVGEQAMADRYTYAPSIGLGMMLVWAVPGQWLRLPAARAGAIGAALATVAMLAGLTWSQTGFWKDSVTLFSRALKTDPDNWLAHNKLARIDFAGGRTESAIAHMREAVRLAPSRGHLLNLGYALETAGRLEEALEAYSRAAASRPPSADAERRLANLLRKMGRPEAAGIHDRRLREMSAAGR
jgi:tetratricopeptide (TPR) repeat protein